MKKIRNLRNYENLCLETVKFRTLYFKIFILECHSPYQSVSLVFRSYLAFFYGLYSLCKKVKMIWIDQPRGIFRFRALLQ